MHRSASLLVIGALALVLVLGVACRGDDDSAIVRLNSDGEENREPGPAAVVSAHELATQAGIEVLARGGTAADAAVAVAAVLSVVEPWFSSVLGGGTWGLYYSAEDDTVTSLDGVGPTGSNASIEAHAPRAGEPGMHQSIVPGAWDGWMLWLDRYGRLDLGDVLAPAIRVARDGHPASGSMAFWLAQSAILSRPDAAAIYAPNGTVLQQGDIVYQHAMADTFEDLIAAYDARRDEGRTAAVQAARDYYYRGPLAETIVQFSDEHGGYLTLDDFHSFEAAIVEPISIEYDDLTVYQNPPNSQGIAMLMALNILKDYDFAGRPPDDPEAVHMQIEALKLALSDRNEYVGDPERVDVPVERLLSDEHAADQRARIEMESALTWPFDSPLEPDPTAPLDLGDTSTFHIIDHEGNAAAVTTSLGAQFMVIGDTGIHINNRMRFLSLEEGNPNELTPGYKVRHTSNPYMVLRNGNPYILGGNTGVDTQPQAQVQQFLDIVEFGLTPQEAVDAPRWVSGAFPASTYPYEVSNVLSIEEDFPPELMEALESRGHVIDVEGGTFGSANIMVISADGADVQIGADRRTATPAGQVVPPPP